MKHIKKYKNFTNESVETYYDNKVKEWDKEFDENFYIWLEKYKNDDFLKNEYKESNSNLPFEKWLRKYYTENVY